MEELFAKIEERFQITLPGEFRELWRRGFCVRRIQVKGDWNANYLHIPEMEWLPLEEIAGFKPPEYQSSGLVPFAASGGGDLWCWQPSETNAQGTRVLLCWHDCRDADVFAPNFNAALFRQLLESAVGLQGAPEEVEKLREIIRMAAKSVQTLFSSERLATLERVLQMPMQKYRPQALRPRDYYLLLPTTELQAILEKDGSFEGLGATVRWMKPVV